MDDDDGFQVGKVLPPPDKNSTIHEGFLKKKSPKMLAFNSWQDRYMRLTKDALFYYRKENAPQYQGAIPLHCIENVVCDRGLFKKKGYRIDIHLQAQYNRIFSFTAKTEAEILEWNQHLQEQHRNVMQSTQHRAPAAGGVGQNDQSQLQVWKPQNPKEKDKKGDKIQDDDQVPRLERRFNNNNKNAISSSLKQQLEQYMLQSQPIYPFFQPQPSQLNIFQNLEVLAQNLMGGFRIESEEQCRELGSIYIIGNQNYPITHQSYLLHSIDRSEEWFLNAVQSMELLSKCQEFPLFPRLVHCGETSDAIYSIYHPPLRASQDSLFSWLAKLEIFPEQIIAWVAAHVLLTLDYLHSQGVSFTSLSPETVFLDGSGTVRVCELFLNSNPTLLTSIPEYTSPELLQYEVIGPSNPAEHPPHHFTADYWRMGILLYELAVGLPPFRPFDNSTEEGGEITPAILARYKADIHNQIHQFAENPASLSFPPTVSPALQDLILTLLQNDPSKRPINQEPIRAHPFFAEQIDAMNEEYATAVNPFTTGFFEMLQQQQQQYQQDPQSVPPPLATEFNFWNLDQLISFPKPQWVQDKVLHELYVTQRDTTPNNLGFAPHPAVVQRVSVGVLHTRSLPRELSQRLVCNVSIGTDTQKTHMGSQVSAEVVEFTGDALTFDILDEQMSHPSSELMIEITTLNNLDKDVGGKNNKKEAKESKPSFVGLVTFPLQQLRQHGVVQSWLTIFDINGLPIGEIELSLRHDYEEIELNAQLLSKLTTRANYFKQCFGKPVPTNNRRLHSLIIDPSTLAQSEQKTSHDLLASTADGPASPTPIKGLPAPAFGHNSSLGPLSPTSGPSNGGAWVSPTLSPIPGRLSHSGTISLPPATYGQNASSGGKFPAPQSPSHSSNSLSGQQQSYHQSAGTGRTSRADALISSTFRQNATTQGTPLYNTMLYETLDESDMGEDGEAPPLPPLPPSTTFVNLDVGEQTIGGNMFSLGIEAIHDGDEEDDEEFTKPQYPLGGNNCRAPPVPIPPPDEDEVPPALPPPVDDEEELPPALPPPVDDEEDEPPALPALPDDSEQSPPAIPALPPSLSTQSSTPELSLPPPLPSPTNSQAPPPLPKAQPQPEPEPQAQPQPEPEPQAQPQPEPEPQAQPQPEPEPQAQPQPEPEPQAQPQPEPEPQEDCAPPPPPPPVEDPNLVLKNWRTVKTPDGKRYYFNKVTRVTSWEPPACLTDYQ